MANTATDIKTEDKVIVPAAQRFVMVSPAQAAAQSLADELAERAANGTQLDKTRPGGYYHDDKGRAHDAHGNFLDVKTKKGDVAKLDLDEVNEELTAMDARRVALLARVEAARAESMQASADASAKAAEAEK